MYYTLSYLKRGKEDYKPWFMMEQVSSMSFYPDSIPIFIQILSNFYPDFIQNIQKLTLSWFYLNWMDKVFFQTLLRFYPDFLKQILSRFYPNFIWIDGHQRAVSVLLRMSNSLDSQKTKLLMNSWFFYLLKQF